MSSIGTLNAKLTADTVGFANRIDKAIAQTDAFEKQWSRTSKLVSGAIAAVATSAIALYVRGVADAVIENLKLARSLDVQADFINSLQNSIHDLGGDSKQAGAGLLSLAEKLDDAHRGGIASADAFARFGLNAEKLAKQPLSAAFADVAESISRIADPTQRASAAYSIFGDKAVALLPTLAQGRNGLLAAAASADKFGTGLNNVQAGAIENASLAIDRAKRVAEGFASQVAVKLAPWIEAAANKLADFGTRGDYAAKLATNGMHGVASAIAITADVLDKLAITVKFLSLSFNTLGYIGSAALASISNLGGFANNKFADEIEKFANGSLIKAAELKQEILDAVGKPSNADAVGKFFADLQIKADIAAKSMEKLKNAGGALAEAFKKNRGFANFASTIENLATPFERFGSELAKLKAGLEDGALSWDRYALGIAKAADNLERAHNLASVSLASGLQRGTAEAQGAIFRSEAESRVQRESPQDRLARLAQQSLDIEKQQLEYAKKLADAATAKPGVAKIP